MTQQAVKFKSLNLVQENIYVNHWNLRRISQTATLNFQKELQFFGPVVAFRLSGVPEIKEDPASRIESYLR